MEKKRYIIPSVKVRAITTASIMAGSVIDTGNPQDPDPSTRHYAKENVIPDGDGSMEINSHNIWDD